MLAHSENVALKNQKPINERVALGKW